MKIVLLIAFCIGIHGQLLAQANEDDSAYSTMLADSFRAIIAHTDNDTTKVRYLILLSWAIEGVSPDSALTIANQAYALASAKQLRLGRASALRAIGYHQKSLGEFAESLKTFYLALEVLGYPIDDDQIIPDSNANGLGSSGLQEYADVQRCIGFLYGDVGNTSEELRQYRKALAIHQALGNEQIIANTTWNIADVYLRTHVLDSAILLAKKGLLVYERDDVPFYVKTYLGTAYNILGEAYFDSTEYAMAEDVFLKAEFANRSYDNRRSLSKTYVNLAKLYLAKEDAGKSLFYANKACVSAIDAGLSNYVANSYAALAAAYQALGNRDSAYYYLAQAAPIRDSLNKAEKKNLIRYQNVLFAENQKLTQLQQEKTAFQNRVKLFTLLGFLGLLISIALLLYRNNRQKQKANRVLQQTLADLKAAQDQLIQSEKMASLGELTAGIAHEIQNPLNFVNNFSEVSDELLDEMDLEFEKENWEEVKAIKQNLKDNLIKITQHGKRADGIVKSMLEHSKRGTGKKEDTNVNALVEEFLQLGFHSFVAKTPGFSCELKTSLDPNLPRVAVIPQDIGKVLLNLINNAFYAVDEKKKQNDVGYAPTVLVTTKRQGNCIEIVVTDNGIGIPDAIRDKIFQPFFTTKPTGSGTGLGLSLSYDIVKAHGGEIRIETRADDKTHFIVQLPAH